MYKQKNKAAVMSHNQFYDTNEGPIQNEFIKPQNSYIDYPQENIDAQLVNERRPNKSFNAMGFSKEFVNQGY